MGLFVKRRLYLPLRLNILVPRVGSNPISGDTKILIHICAATSINMAFLRCHFFSAFQQAWTFPVPLLRLCIFTEAGQRASLEERRDVPSDVQCSVVGGARAIGR